MSLTFDIFRVEFDAFEIGQILKSIERSIIEEEFRPNQMKSVQISIVDKRRGIHSSGFVRFNRHGSDRIIRKLLARDQFDHLREFRGLDLSIELSFESVVTSRCQA